jgi:hypothetical protein
VDSIGLYRTVHHSICEVAHNKYDTPNTTAITVVNERFKVKDPKDGCWIFEGFREMDDLHTTVLSAPDEEGIRNAALAG